MQRIVMAPPPAEPTFMIGVILAGAVGAQAAQAANSFAACVCVNLQDTPNTSALASGNTSSLNSVAMPKLPPPPPLHAQNRSGSEAALAVSTRDCASTMLTCCMLSQVRPWERASNPCPPPRIWPETPTVGQLPACSASPLAATA